MDAVIDHVNQTSDHAGNRGFDMPLERWRWLFAEVADGRSEALSEIYDASVRKLFGLALWRTGTVDDASDVVQDVFIRLAEQGVKLRKIKDPRAWLLTVTHRIGIDVLRKRKRHPSESLEFCALVEASSCDPDRLLDAERASAHLAMISESQRDVIYLRHFADCTFSQISNVLGIPTFTAASRYRLGIKKLRRLMEKR